MQEMMREKLTVSQNAKKLKKIIPCLMWNSKFIAISTRSYGWALSWARWIQLTPSHFTKDN